MSVKETEKRVKQLDPPNDPVYITETRSGRYMFELPPAKEDQGHERNDVSYWGHTLWDTIEEAEAEFHREFPNGL